MKVFKINPKKHQKIRNILEHANFFLFAILILVFVAFMVQGFWKYVIKNESTNTPYDFSHIQIPISERELKCPEDYSSPENYIKDLDAFLESFNPDSTLEDIGKERMKFLEDNNCEETLDYMARESSQEKIKIEDVQFSGQMDPQKIGPEDKMIQFLGKNFGPYTINIDKDTEVRSTYYPIDGQETGDAEVEIILNFYLQNIYSSEPFSLQSISYNLRENVDINVISFFEAPDPINEKQAFYIAADYVSVEGGYGWAYIMKMASIGEDAYMVGLSKLFLGQTEEEIQGLIDNWLLKNMKVCGEALGNIGADESWLEFFDETNFEEVE